jgi:hypothetical protein
MFPGGSTKGKAPMARPEKKLPTETITITVTGIMADHVDAIIQTGLYGNSRAACCERLLCQSISNLLKDKSLIRHKPVDI